ncbi:MAG: hypothetical protein Fur0039_27110 [Rhodocyclaceae bacterium]
MWGVFVEGVLAMSEKERDRLRVIEAVVGKRLRQVEAAKRLGLSVRQVKRLVRAHRQAGAAGLVSRRRGRPSNRRIGQEEREAVLACVRSRYADFGPTLAAEYLTSFHGFTRSVESLRKWMIEDGLWAPKRQRHKRPFQLRERRACVGELVQIDGSPHAWLEGRGPRCTLISFIDDATGRLQYARFTPAGTSRAYLSGLRAYVARHGRPVAFYSDRHSIFTKHDPEDPTPTQFERAVRDLGIEPILALSPQAEGRVERAFQTLQDRLVKALRLAGIDTLEAANALLAPFIEHYNARFAKPPRHPQDAHRPAELDAERLFRITCEQHKRTSSKSLSCQYRGRQYLIQTKGAPAYHLRGAKITVCDDGTEGTIVLPTKAAPCPTVCSPATTCQAASPMTRPWMPMSRPPSGTRARRARILPPAIPGADPSIPKPPRGRLRLVARRQARRMPHREPNAGEKKRGRTPFGRSPRVGDAVQDGREPVGNGHAAAGLSEDLSPGAAAVEGGAEALVAAGAAGFATAFFGAAFFGAAFFGAAFFGAAFFGAAFLAAAFFGAAFFAAGFFAATFFAAGFLAATFFAAGFLAAAFFAAGFFAATFFTAAFLTAAFFAAGFAAAFLAGAFLVVTAIAYLLYE